MTEETTSFLQEAIRIACENVKQGGGPFGALVVKDSKIIARGANRVTASHDPTAHAEVVAIRAACEFLGTFQLSGCELYTSCEPCPMCLGAIYWARPDRVFYAAGKELAADAGFDDAFIYRELALPMHERTLDMQQGCEQKATEPFVAWKATVDKMEY